MKTLKYILLLPLLLFFVACEDVIDVDLNEEDLDLIGVEAYVSTIRNPYVYVSRSLKVSDEQSNPGISGARVSVSDDQVPANRIELFEDPENQGLYQVPIGQIFLGESGREYTLTIEVDGVTIEGSDHLNPVEPIDSIEVRPSLRGDEQFLGVFINAQENPGKGDYYKWDIFINDTLLYEAGYIFVASDEIVDGNYVYDLEIMTDFHNPDEPEERRLKLGDVIRVEQKAISRFAYEYYFQMVNQAFTGGLFSVPPANIQSNLSSSDGKKVLGIFTAQDISVSEEFLIDESLEGQLNK